MQIYKYWVLEKAVLMIKEGPLEIKCWGGSSVSKDDARIKAREKARKIENKIKGSRKEFEEYEASIREEIVKEFGDHAIVTRNRYGAEVLNAQSTMFLDIDYPPPSLLNFFKKADVKAAGIKRIKKLAPKYPRLGFRIYETHKGIRAIVLGASFEARSREAQKIMKDFNCDRLYVFLCKKQNCFRARLTPKPYRMKIRKMKFVYPYDPSCRDEMDSWLQEYRKAACDFRTCHFIEHVGAQHSLDGIVLYHDDVTGAHYNLPLA